MKSRMLILSIALFFNAVSIEAQATQRGLAIAPNPGYAGACGNYHALIIGINDYQEWPRLQTAVKDATVIRDTLVSRYGFLEKNVILRTDKAASRQNIARDLRYIARSMGNGDNLLIYYAGHGQLDDFTGDGYWVPAEGAMKDPDTWLANSYIKAILSSEKLQAKNVVVIADSCYSGSMLRGGPSLMSLDDQRYREKLAEKASLRSRQVISSGGVEPVADGGADGHSLFAFYLIDALRKNDREVIDLENLFHTRVWKPVSEIGDQRPNVGRLRTPMDQDGQFVLYNAAWAREQAAHRAALEAQQQEQARQKASVASAELELQRQRFEMEKMKLEYEKEQLAQQKTLEMERLKLEKQKQEIEYARLQAQMEAMEQKRKLAEQQAAAIKPTDSNFQAALERKAPDSRRAARDSYKLALLPVRVRSDYNREERVTRSTISAVGKVSYMDDRLSFRFSYRLLEKFPESIKLLPDGPARQEEEIWHKKSMFSKVEPNWENLEKISAQLDVDLIALYNINHTRGGYIDVYLYDCKNKKRYTHTNAQLAAGGQADYLEILLRKFYRDRR